MKYNIIMKKITLFYLLMGFTLSMYAQDIIVTKNSEKIEAKVVEVAKDYIKYYKYNYEDGPTYILSTTDVVSIVYANGTVETFLSKTDDQKAANKQFSPFNLNNDQLYHHYKRCFITGSTFLGITGALLTTGILTGAIIEWDFGISFAVMSVPTLIIGTACLVAGKKGMRHLTKESYEVANLYTNSKSKVSFAVTPSGMGLAVTF